MRVRSAIVLAGLAALVAAPMAAASPAAPAGVLVIDTLAGNGERGNTGDGGPATRAKLNMPASIAVDGAGNVYVNQETDRLAQDSVRKVDPKGVISTVLGTGDKLPTKDGIPVAQAGLGNVLGLAAAKSGTLYVLAEVMRNSRPSRELYRVDGAAMIRLVAGGGSTDIGMAKKGLEADLAGTHAVGMDPAGDVYLVTNRRLARLDRATSDLTLIAGNGADRTTEPVDGKDATKVPLVGLWSVAEDNAGNIYVGSTSVLYRVSKKDGKIFSFLCGGEVEPGQCGLNQLATSPWDAPHFSVFYDRVAKRDADGKVKRVAGGSAQGYGGDGGKAADAKLNAPGDIEFDAAGNLYIADTVNNRIRKVSPQAPPVAKDDSAKTDPGKEISGDVLANDAGTKLTVTAHTEPKNGTVTLPANGKFSYTPKNGFTGEDSFTYTVTDSVGQTATAKVTVAVGVPAAQGSNGPGGGLAATGASVVGLTAAAAGLLGVGGGLIVFTARRRRVRR